MGKKTTISDRRPKSDLPDNIAENILNSSRSMLSIITHDYRYIKVNSAFCSAHRMSPEQMNGKTLSEIWGESTFLEKIKDNVDSCFRGNTIKYEASFETPNYGHRFYEVVFRPIIRADGRITHLLAETFDVTDVRLSRQILNDMEEEFRRIETNLPIGFLRCEPDGAVIQANKAFLKIMECDKEADVLGINLREFYIEKGLFDIHIRQLLHEQRKTFGRVPLYTFRKTEIACRISGFIVTGDGNTPPYIDFAFEDSSRELMLENRLIQAQKLETIGALAGGLAHDFNNILATIYGYSELLLDELTDNGTASEKVSRIISAVTRARSLTSQILTFSRQVEQQKIAVGIHEVLKETIGFVESGIPPNIRVMTDIPVIDAMVYADPTQLFRVFLNLMTNAIQAMEDRGGTLNVTLSVVEGIQVQHELSRNIVADEYAQIVFEDTGIGMEPSVVQRIFEPYFTTKEGGRGTGMGLSVVHGIVTEIEGEILVSSKPDKGTIFTLYLPVSHDYTAETDSESGKKLLFITGNRYESRILSIALEKSGYRLLFASDPNSIWTMISDYNRKPDLIIYMDDAEEVSANDISDLFTEHDISVPLILITDNDQYLAKELLLNSGVAKQVLIKPVSLKEMQNAIYMSLA